MNIRRYQAAVLALVLLHVAGALSLCSEHLGGHTPCQNDRAIDADRSHLLLARSGRRHRDDRQQRSQDQMRVLDGELSGTFQHVTLQPHASESLFSSPRMQRMLQQSNITGDDSGDIIGDVTIVTSPFNLQEAIAAGAEHIEIRDHLDLTMLDKPEEENLAIVTYMLGAVTSSVKSIRGRCGQAGEPSFNLNATHAPLRSLLPNQCVLLANERLLEVAGGNLWLDALYFRYPEAAETGVLGTRFVDVYRSDTNVFMTSVTFQGNGDGDEDCGVCAMSVFEGANVYAEDCSFSDFEGKSVLAVANGVSVALLGCSFNNNTIYASDFGVSGVLTVTTNPNEEGDEQFGNSEVRIESSPFLFSSFDSQLYNSVVMDNRGAADSEGVVYSDSSVVSICLIDGDDGASSTDPPPATCGLGEVLPLAQAAAVPFLNASDTWFVELQQELEEPPPDTNTAAVPSDSGDGGSDISWEFIFGPIVAVLIVAAAAVAAVVFLKRRQIEKRRARRKDDTFQNVTVGSTTGNAAIAAANDPRNPNNSRRSKDQGSAFSHNRRDNDPGSAFSSGLLQSPHSAGHTSANREVHTAKRQDKAQARAPALATSSEGTLSTNPSTNTNPSTTNPSTVNGNLLQNAASSPCSPWTPPQHTGSPTKPPPIPHPRPQKVLQSPPHTACSTSTGPRMVTGGLLAPLSPLRPTSGARLPPLARGSPLKPASGTQSMGRKGSSTVDTFDLPRTAGPLMSRPAPNAPVDVKIDFLQQQLDLLGVEQPILGHLVLLGRGSNLRLQGGQAIVQMARSLNNSSDYAIKFFVSRSAFNTEAALYKQSGDTEFVGLAQFLPQVLLVESNTNKAIVDPQGHALPPCIVLERGESLDIWAARAQPDRAQAFSMIQQLALRMKAFHALGYVHRDLKPANVMWLPRENRWTIIDFGCVSKTGTNAPLTFTISYAAPEVIAAHRNKESSMVVEESLDVWSLGVMAFELLTGQPVARMHMPKEQVMDEIQGVNGQMLPFEGALLTTKIKRKLGVFKNLVLLLLARNPQDRPTMAQFCASCDRVLAGSTTGTGTGGAAVENSNVQS